MGTLTIRGMKLRNGSRRRYLVVAVRPVVAYAADGRPLKAFVETRRRSDNLHTATLAAQATYRDLGVAIVVIDTVTGEELFARNPREVEV